MAKLDLSMVTLCAATSVNVPATIGALRASAAQATFGESLLLTDVTPSEPLLGIRVVPIGKLQSSKDYSAFVLNQLADHVTTPFCLIVQWDGFVLDGAQWNNGFLDYDYIGAPWPQFADGHDVGNGGFSLRSRRLLEACRLPGFQTGHPEDIAIGRTNRLLLEERHQIRFADRQTAARFAFERARPDGSTFGFHGIFNLAGVLGVDRFWELYRELDDPSTAFVDYCLLMKQLGRGQNSPGRRLKLTMDRLAGLFRR